MDKDELLRKVKEAIHEVEPDAEIILYGSRSRGDFVTQSDWDFLILVDGHLDEMRIDTIRHRLYEIEWESDEVLCSIIRNLKQWNSNLYRAMPFHQRVEKEGTKL